MAKKTSMAIMVVPLVVVILGMVVQIKAEAKLHEVGDAIGWGLPVNDTNYYLSWASNHNFSFGDILEFNFTNGESDLVRVTKEAYNNCNASNPYNVTFYGPYKFTLNDTTSDYYFICTFGSHCSKGQKLAINVIPSSIPSPVPDESPSANASDDAPSSPTHSRHHEYPSSSASSFATLFSLFSLHLLVSLVLIS